MGTPGPVVSRSILVGEHDREARAAGLVGVNQRLQRVKALPAGAGDDDFEETTAGERTQRGNAGHPENVMPDAAPVVGVLRMCDRLLDEGEDRRRHGDMDTEEVLGRNLGEVAGGGVGKDAVGDGLGAGVNGNDGEAVKRMAGLVDYVAGLRCRIAGEVTHGIGGSVPERGHGMQRAALRGARLSRTDKIGRPGGMPQGSTVAQGGAQRTGRGTAQPPAPAVSNA